MVLYLKKEYCGQYDIYEMNISKRYFHSNACPVCLFCWRENNDWISIRWYKRI